MFFGIGSRYEEEAEWGSLEQRWIRDGPADNQQLSTIAESRKITHTLSRQLINPNFSNFHQERFRDFRREGLFQFSSRGTLPVFVKREFTNFCQEGTLPIFVKRDLTNFRQEGLNQFLSRGSLPIFVKSDFTNYRQEGLYQFLSRGTLPIFVKRAKRKSYITSARVTSEFGLTARPHERACPRDVQLKTIIKNQNHWGAQDIIISGGLVVCSCLCMRVSYY